MQPSEVAALLDPVSMEALVLGQAVLVDDPVAAHGWQRTWPSGAASSRRWTGTIARWESRGPVYGEIIRRLRCAPGRRHREPRRMSWPSWRFLAQTPADDAGETDD
ncbi:MAG: hypothetical protein R2838_08530 [Caldilineaceae bacterium]